jgi:signal transduction histidine kinase
MEEKASETRESLEWMTTDKLLELVAHDINNMCHATLSYIDLALDPSQGPEARTKFLTTAKVMAHRASRFAPHLRAMNELRGTQLSATPSATIAKAASEAKAKASELNSGAPLTFTTSGDALEARVRGGAHLTSVLTHLFDNALRFQKPGGKAAITLEARREGEAVVLTVRDNGRGFAKGAEAYASKRFTTPGSVSGAGLGLAYVRLFTERSGGTLTLGSHAGGAEVRLKLPLAPSA